jgi:hypothetical protein
VFPYGLIEGLLLAATAMGDAGGDAMIAGLAPGLARTFRARFDELDALSRGTRHAKLRAMVLELSQLPPDAASSKALAFFAKDGSPPRSGVRPHRSLETTLRRAASWRDARADELAMLAEASWRE